MKQLTCLLLACLLLLLAGCGQQSDEHIHDFSRKEASPDYLAKEAGCLIGELYYYSCSICHVAGDQVFLQGSSLGHDFTPEACARCGWAADANTPLGETHSWSYFADGTLVFFGEGALPDKGEVALWAFKPIRTLVLTEGITAIGADYFKNLAGLTTLILPEGLTTIGASAFASCERLTTLSLPSTLEHIGESAFRSCESLKQVTIPASVSKIEGNVFAYCGSLESVTVEQGNPAYASVQGCVTELATGKLIIGAGSADLSATQGITAIGKEAFAGCVGLQKLHIPATVQTIEEDVFAGCSSLTSITADRGNPAYLASGNCLIEKESGLLIRGCQSSVIPTDGSVSAIGEYAFSDCDGLTKVHIPASVTAISHTAFNRCTGLSTITCEAGNPHFYAVDNCLIIASSRTILLGCKNSVIPKSEGVIRIGNGAFAETDISEMIIPDNITEIGEAAFAGCRKLTKLSIGKGITALSAKDFMGASALEEIILDADHPTLQIVEGSLVDPANKTLVMATTRTTIPTDGSITALGAYAFAGRTSLTELYIPLSVTVLGEGVFYGCSALRNIWYEGTGNQWKAIQFGANWSTAASDEILVHYNRAN